MGRERMHQQYRLGLNAVPGACAVLSVACSLTLQLCAACTPLQASCLMTAPIAHAETTGSLDNIPSTLSSGGEVRKRQKLQSP